MCKAHHRQLNCYVLISLLTQNVLAASVAAVQACGSHQGLVWVAAARTIRHASLSITSRVTTRHASLPVTRHHPHHDARETSARLLCAFHDRFKKIAEDAAQVCLNDMMYSLGTRAHARALASSAPALKGTRARTSTAAKLTAIPAPFPLPLTRAYWPHSPHHSSLSKRNLPECASA